MVFDKIYLMKNNRGQLSMEFILIMSIVLILLLTLTVPMRDVAESNVSAFTKVSYAEKALYDVYHAIKKLDTVDSARITVDFYLPDDVNFGVLDGVVYYKAGFDFNAQAYSTNCVNNVCEKRIATGITTLNQDEKNIKGRYSYTFNK